MPPSLFKRENVPQPWTRTTTTAAASCCRTISITSIFLPSMTPRLLRPLHPLLSTHRPYTHHTRSHPHHILPPSQPSEHTLPHLPSSLASPTRTSPPQMRLSTNWLVS